MKLIQFTLLFICFSLLSIAQTPNSSLKFKNDLIRQKLKGKIATVTEKDYNALGDSLILKSVSTFDDNGNETEFFTYSASGATLSKTTFKYNDSGKLVEEQRYKADGALNVKTTCKYDEKGNKIEESNFDASGTLFMKVASKFDGKGNRIVKDSYNEFGSLFLKCNSKFDDKGNEVEAKEYDSHHGLKYTTTYDYDKADNAGNWTRKTTYKNDEPAAVTLREITYR